jgi:ABC-2 type transport system ATP-binding protein
MDRATMRQRITEVLDLVDLQRDADKRALEYSGGMRKLLDVASGLVHQPRVLFLDEPTAGLDITHRHRLLDYVRDLPSTGMTVFLTSHFLEEVDQLAGCVALMNHGTIVARGSPASLKAGVGTRIIDITIGSGPADAHAAAVAQIRTLPAVRKVVVDGVRLKLFTEGDDGLLGVVRQLVLDRNLTITSVTLAEPTLNDVFVFHTDNKELPYGIA